MALLGGQTLGQNWRPGQSLSMPQIVNWSVWRTYCVKAGTVLREEGRSPCLVPQHRRREIPLIKKGTKSGNFNIQSKNLQKGERAREIGKIHETEMSPNQAFHATFSRATKEASLPSRELLWILCLHRNHRTVITARHPKKPSQEGFSVLSGTHREVQK